MGGEKKPRGEKFTARFELRLTPHDLNKLIRYAESKGKTATDILRGYINRLPNRENLDKKED